MAIRTPSALSRRRIETAREKSPISTPSVISSSSRDGAKPGLEQHRVHEAGEVAVAELDRRQVDRDLQRLRPGGGLAAGLAQHPFADRHDEPAFLGERDEGAGRDQATLRMLPARQRLEAGDLAVDARLRLVVQHQLAALDRRSQVVLERAPLAQPLVHVGLEEADRAAPLGLGAIERGVGVAEQRGGVGAVDRIDRDPDAQPDAQAVAVDLEILRDGGEQAARPAPRPRRPAAGRRSR